MSYFDIFAHRCLSILNDIFIQKVFGEAGVGGGARNLLKILQI